MFRLILLSCLMLSAMVFSGCNGNATYDYSQDSGSMVRFTSPEQATATVSVTPFIDIRDFKRSGSSLLGMIPLMPYGYTEATQPETTEGFYSVSYYDFYPPYNLAQSAIQSLRVSGLFKEVNFVNYRDKNTGDYTFRGTVLNSDYKARWFTYGLTYFGATPLWILGCPTGSSSIHLRMRFELIDNATKEIVWTYDIDENDYLNHWLYCRYQADTDLMPILMKRAMNKALNTLYLDKIIR